MTQPQEQSPATPRTRAGDWWVDALAPGLAYYFAAKLALLLAIHPSEAAPVWPAAGVAIAAVALRGYRVLPGLAVAVALFYAGSWFDGGSIVRTSVLTLLLTLGPVVQSAVAGALLRRYVGADNLLVDDRSILRLLLIGGPLGCMVAATMNVTVMAAYGIVPWHEYALTWLTWWIGDSIGAMVVVPLLLVCFGPSAQAAATRRLSVSVPMGVLLAVVIAAFAFVQQRERAAVDQLVSYNARALHDEIQRRIATQVETVASLASFVNSQSALAPNEFSAFARGILARHPNLQALEWIPRVAHGQRFAFEHDPLHPVQITEPSPSGEMVSAEVRNEYFPVKFVVPLAGNERAAGYDVSTNPVARDAQLRALGSRSMAATAPIRLIQESGSQSGIVLYAPVYRDPAATDLAGFVAGVVRMADYIAPSIDAWQALHPPLGIRIVDLQSGRPIFESTSFGQAQALFEQHGARAVLRTEVAGRTWRVEYLPEQALLDARSSWPVWYVLSGGLLFTALLGGWLLSLTGRTLQISQVVAERTAHLHSEIAAREAIQEELATQASEDQLTGLVNRREFERRLSLAIEEAREHGVEHAFCFLDLDQFKVVNDTSGHIAGDELLRRLAAMLRERIRRTDTLARLGGDEFGVLITHCGLDDACRTANGLREAIEQFEFPWDDRVYSVGSSFGVVAIGPDSSDLTEVLRQADSACYAAKDSGRNRIHVYTEDDAVLAQRRGEIHWASELDAALGEDRLMLYAQPLAALQDASRRPAIELLLRLRGRDGQIVPPGAFLPAAERYGRSARLDRWVVEHALAWLAEHAEFTQRIEYCSINLSARSLAESSVFDVFTAAARKGALAPRKVMFEITETAAITNLVEAREQIRKMQLQGCRFALDDFGSGVSSYAYLKALGIDCLKIDGLFVKDVMTDEVDLAIVESVHSIASAMGMDTVAEFVESPEILERIRAVGVDYAQGYAIAKPMPLDDLLVHPLFVPPSLSIVT